MRFDLTLSAVALASLQAAACAKVNTAAETARQAWITPGAGQAMEYMQSQAEVIAASAAPDPLDPTQYPMMAAELAAHIASGATTTTLRQVVTSAAAQIAAYRTAGSAIKQARMTATLQIAGATSAAAINAIVAGVVWPTPS